MRGSSYEEAITLAKRTEKPQKGAQENWERGLRFQELGSSSAKRNSNQRDLQERTDRPCHVADLKKMREHSSYDVPKQMLTRISESHVSHVASDSTVLLTLQQMRISTHEC